MEPTLTTFGIALLNYGLGWWWGRRKLRLELTDKLDAMTCRYLNAHQAAETWKDEVEELAERIKEQDNE